MTALRMTSSQAADLGEFLDKLGLLTADQTGVRIVGSFTVQLSDGEGGLDSDASKLMIRWDSADGLYAVDEQLVVSDG